MNDISSYEKKKKNNDRVDWKQYKGTNKRWTVRRMFIPKHEKKYWWFGSRRRNNFSQLNRSTFAFLWTGSSNIFVFAHKCWTISSYLTNFHGVQTAFSDVNSSISNSWFRTSIFVLRQISCSTIIANVCESESFRRIFDVNNFLLIETLPWRDDFDETNAFWSTVLICKLILISIILNTIARPKLFYITFHPKLVLIDGREKTSKWCRFVYVLVAMATPINEWNCICISAGVIQLSGPTSPPYIGQDNLPDEAIRDHAKRINKSRGWRDVLRNIVESYAWFRAWNKVNTSRVS